MELVILPACASKVCSTSNNSLISSVCDLYEAIEQNNLEKVRQVVTRAIELGQLYSVLMFKNGDEEIPLFSACKEDSKSEIVNELLRYHSQEQLQSKNVIGDTPVHVSAFKGNFRVLESMYDTDRACITYVGRFGNLPIHAACAGRGLVGVDVVRKLIEWYKDIQTDVPSLKEDARFVENDFKEIPLHLACKYGENREIVRELLKFHGQAQLEAKNKIFGNTPIHNAASFNSTTNILEYILTTYDAAYLLQLTNNILDTPVHSATYGAKIEILKLMHLKCPNCTAFKGLFSSLPLHVASRYGLVEVARFLLHVNPSSLEAPSEPIDLPAVHEIREPLEFKNEEQIVTFETDVLKVTTWSKKNDTKINQHSTPLTVGCQFGNVQIVKFLLAQGAKIHPLALIKAIEGMYKECVKQLIFKNGIEDRECRFIRKKPFLVYYPSRDNTAMMTTPFRELIKYMPDLAEKVLDSCTFLNRFLVTSSNFEVIFRYEMINNQSLMRPSFAEKSYSNPLNTLQKAFDAEDKLKDELLDKRRSIESTEAHDNYHKDYSCKYTNDVDYTSTYHMESPLLLMTKHKQTNLLTHPLVASYIHLKWKSIYGVWSYLMFLAYALVFMISSNTLLFLLPNPSSAFCTDNNETLLTTNDTTNMKPRHAVASYILLSLIILLYSMFRLLLEGFQIFNSLNSIRNSSFGQGSILYHLLTAIKKFDYLWDLSNWIEIPLFVLSVVFSGMILLSNVNNFCVSPGTWQIGVIVMWLSWSELVIMSMQFQFVGVHVLMFLKVFKSLFKIVPIAFLLIVSFGFTFYLLLYQPDLKGSPYYSAGYSTLNMLSVLVEGTSLEEFYGLDIHGGTHNNNHILYDGLSLCFWILTLLILTIIFSNLMIGIAVGDIQMIYEKAHFEKLILQVKYIMYAESQMKYMCDFLKCLKPPKRNRLTFKPNENRSFRSELVYFLWGGVRYDSEESINRLLCLH